MDTLETIIIIMLLSYYPVKYLYNRIKDKYFNKG